MTGSVRERIEAARRSSFVGRGEELAFFRAVVAQRPPHINIIFVHGPGGVGKSALLSEYASLMVGAGGQAVMLDSRSIEPTPSQFLGALCNLLGCPHPNTLPDALSTMAPIVALFVDTYELITPLDDWIRGEFLPNLPQNVVLVIASRHAPSPAWRSDPGLGALMRVIALRNLRPQEGKQYLTQRGIPLDQQQRVLGFTHSHPLALSLIADTFAQYENFVFQPEHTPDIVKTLVDRFIEKVPTPDQRAALEICALVRLTTEAQLTHMLPNTDGHALFEWLCSLSLIQKGPEGVFPHDLAREALMTELRWRNPVRYGELHAAARAFYITQIGITSGLRQQQRIFDLIYLHRENAVVRPYFEWALSNSPLTDTLRPTDLQALIAMTTRYEGPESGRIASYWLSRRPGGATVWRDGRGQPIGFSLTLPLHDISPAEAENDPAVTAIHRYLSAQAPLRPSERATLFRFWMDGEVYQGVSPIQSLIFVNAVRHYLTSQGEAITFFPVADPDFWAGVFAYASLERIPSADYTVDGRRYGVYGHDWRIMRPLAWLALLAQRETAQLTQAPPAAAPMLTVLSEVEFAEAVREALRGWNEPIRQAENPLTNSRMVTEHARQMDASSGRGAVLQSVIEQALQDLAHVPRAERAYKALYHTYIQPAPTQEQAAERLDLPFSTYRRHLKTGLEWLIARLWSLEIGK